MGKKPLFSALHEKTEDIKEDCTQRHAQDQMKSWPIDRRIRVEQAHITKLAKKRIGMNQENTKRAGGKPIHNRAVKTNLSEKQEQENGLTYNKR